MMVHLNFSGQDLSKNVHNKYSIQVSPNWPVRHTPLVIG